MCNLFCVLLYENNMKKVQTTIKDFIGERLIAKYLSCRARQSIFLLGTTEFYVLIPLKIIILKSTFQHYNVITIKQFNKKKVRTHTLEFFIIFIHNTPFYCIRFKCLFWLIKILIQYVHNNKCNSNQIGNSYYNLQILSHCSSCNL